MVSLLDKAILPPLCIFFLLKLILAFSPDFSDYPPASQSCIFQADGPSRCETGATNPVTYNECFCINGGNILTNAVKCIDENNTDDLENVWNVMVYNCDSTDTPLTFTWSEFLAAAQSGASSGGHTLTIASLVMTPTGASQASSTSSQRTSSSTTSTSAPAQTNSLQTQVGGGG